MHTNFIDTHNNGGSKYQNKHGKRNTIAYRAWDHMIQRCHNTSKNSYPDYGGRGIKVYPKWRYSFIEFYKYVSKLDGYEDFHSSKNRSEKISIERIDVNKNYEPGNIEWIKWKFQVYNRRVSKTNKTGYTGICWNKNRKKYTSKICYKRKQIQLGYFDSIEEAVKIRDEYIIKNNLPHKLSTQ